MWVCPAGLDGQRSDLCGCVQLASMDKEVSCVGVSGLASMDKEVTCVGVSSLASMDTSQRLEKSPVVCLSSL